MYAKKRLLSRLSAFQTMEIRLALLAGVLTALYSTVDVAVLKRFFDSPTGVESYLIAGSWIGIALTLVLGALVGRRVDPRFGRSGDVGSPVRRFTVDAAHLLSALRAPLLSRGSLSASKPSRRDIWEQLIRSWHFWAVLTALAGVASTWCTLHALDSAGVVQYLAFAQVAIILVFVIETSRKRRDANSIGTPGVSVLGLLFMLLLSSLATVLTSLQHFTFNTPALPFLAGVVASSVVYNLCQKAGMRAANADAVTFRFVSFFWMTVGLSILVFFATSEHLGLVGRWQEVWKDPFPKLLVIGLSMVIVFRAFTAQYRARQKPDTGDRQPLPAWLVAALTSISVAIGAVVQFVSWIAARSVAQPRVYFAGATAFMEQPTEPAVWAIRTAGALAVVVVVIVCARSQKE